MMRSSRKRHLFVRETLPSLADGITSTYGCKRSKSRRYTRCLPGSPLVLSLLSHDFKDFVGQVGQEMMDTQVHARTPTPPKVLSWIIFHFPLAMTHSPRLEFSPSNQRNQGHTRIAKGAIDEGEYTSYGDSPDRRGIRVLEDGREPSGSSSRPRSGTWRNRPGTRNANDRHPNQGNRMGAMLVPRGKTSGMT